MEGGGRDFAHPQILAWRSYDFQGIILWSKGRTCSKMAVCSARSYAYYNIPYVKIPALLCVLLKSKKTHIIRVLLHRSAGMTRSTRKAFTTRHQSPEGTWHFQTKSAAVNRRCKIAVLRQEFEEKCV